MKKIISICLCLTLILSLGISAFACTTACLNGADSYPRKGTVTPVGHGLFLREHHNTSSTVYGQLASNDKMNISYKSSLGLGSLDWNLNLINSFPTL